MQALTSAVSSRPTEVAVRDMATGAARSVVKQELTRHAEREEARWQVGERSWVASGRAY